MEVFKTTDPDINWDGKNFESGNISPDGAYYYTIKVNTKRLNGIETLQFSGTIQLQDGKQPLSSE
jgi:flagellar hook assembly protein FlgD